MSSTAFELVAQASPPLALVLDLGAEAGFDREQVASAIAKELDRPIAVAVQESAADTLVVTVDAKQVKLIHIENALATHRRPQTEDEWYERAHRLHFHSNKTQQALSAWLAYLARYPQGSFTSEATFNRAVCLAKLGDNDGAVDALLPLARGNTSRASAARRLLEALDSRP